MLWWQEQRLYCWIGEVAIVLARKLLAKELLAVLAAAVATIAAAVLAAQLGGRMEGGTNGILAQFTSSRV